MCGISGLISFKPLTEHRLKIARALSKRLITNSEIRGRDASGIAAISFASEFNIIYKEGIKGSELAKKPEFTETIKSGSQIILLHTRAATHGKVEVSANNHPHYNKETGNTLIHNGIISNYEDLKKAYGLVMDGDCDSEIILKLIDKFGFNKAIKKISGSVAIAHNNQTDKLLSLYRNSGNPLNLVYLKQYDFFIFCSTKDILDESLSFGEAEYYGLTFPKTLPYLKLSFDENDKYVFNFNNQQVKAWSGIKTKEWVWKSKDTEKDYGSYKGYYYDTDKQAFLPYNQKRTNQTTNPSKFKDELNDSKWDDKWDVEN